MTWGQSHEQWEDVGVHDVPTACAKGLRQKQLNNSRNFLSGWRDRYTNNQPWVHKITENKVSRTKMRRERAPESQGGQALAGKEGFLEEEVHDLNLEKWVDFAKAGETQCTKSWRGEGHRASLHHKQLLEPQVVGKEWWQVKQETDKEDFPGSPVVKTSPSNAGGASSIIPGQGDKIPYASGPKKTKHKTVAIL